jgi:hypothetical protein
MSLFICVCRLDIARTGKNIVANMVLVANAFILCRITGISVIMRRVISNTIAIGMMAIINTVATIVEMTTGVAMTAEMTIVATKAMIAEMDTVKQQSF